VAIDPQYAIIILLFIPFSHFGVGSDDWYRHWLHIPRTDGKPRKLLATNAKTFLGLGGIYPIVPFIEKIKKVRK
jgi:hypothetical protein